MNRLYAAMMINALALVALTLFEVWSGGGLDGDLFAKLIGSGLVVGIYLGFVAVFKMDFDAWPSRRLGYAILGLVTAIEAMVLVGIWGVWPFGLLFGKAIGTLVILTALCFYLLSLREDLIREKRQKDNGFLD